jgi:hypothetical protein
MPEYDTFHGFENLQCLALNECSLYGHLPNWLAKLKKLRGLVLDNNKLSGPIPTWINSLNLLFYLDISNNNLNGDIPTELMEMPTFKSAHSDPIVLKFPIYLTPFLQYRATSGFPKMLNLATSTPYTQLEFQQLSRGYPTIDRQPHESAGARLILQ